VVLDGGVAVSKLIFKLDVSFSLWFKISIAEGDFFRWENGGAFVQVSIGDTSFD